MFSEKSKGYFAILFTTFLYGWFGVFVKIIGDTLPFFYQMMTRNAFVVMVLLVFLVITRNRIVIPTWSDGAKIVGRGVVGAISMTICFMVFKELTIGLAYLSFFVGLLFGGFILGTVVNREKLTWIKVFALALAVIGITLAYVWRIGKVGDLLLVSLAIVAGVASSAWNVFTQHISRRHSAMELNLYDYCIGFVFTLYFTLALQEPWVLPELTTPWITSFAFAVVFILTGFLIPYGFRRIEAQIGSIMSPLEIVFGIIIGYLVLHEPVNVAMIVGCVCITIAAVLPYIGVLSDTVRTRRR